MHPNFAILLLFAGFEGVIIFFFPGVLQVYLETQVHIYLFALT